MRAFSWQYFKLTGDVDAYLLYKDAENGGTANSEDDAPPEPEDGQDDPE